MTIHDEVFLASAWPALYEQHGQGIAYRPRGVEDDEVALEGLWQPGQLAYGYQPEDVGLVVEHFGVLRLRPPDAADAHPSDLFVIDGDVWAVARVVRRRPLLTVQLRRYDQEHVRGMRRIER
ncbi:MAG: hypothetical protein KF878_00135 [Planctomycetes bacterium]|nr:hypothetical protein [Planctomycetota bacterium]